MILKISTETHDSPRKSKKFAYLSCRSDHHDQPWTWSRTHGAGLKRIGANFLQKSEAWFWDGISSLRNILEIYWNILETTLFWIIFQPCENVRPVFGTEKGSIPFAVLWIQQNPVLISVISSSFSVLFCFCHFTLIQASASWIIYIYSYMHIYIYIYTHTLLYIYIYICI